MKNHFVTLTTVFALGTSISGCSYIKGIFSKSSKKEEHAHGEEKKETRKVALTSLKEFTFEQVEKAHIPTFKVVSGDLEVYTSLFGKVDLHPDKALHLHPKLPGVVQDVFKTVGDKIRVGETLARVVNNVGLQSYELVSSINGVVLDRKIAPGQSVNEEIEAFIVGDTSTLALTLTAYAKDVPTLKIGQAVRVVGVSSNLAIESKVNFIAPVLDERTRTATILSYIDNNNDALRVGQFIIGKIVTATAKVNKMIPNISVFQVGDENYVFKKHENKYLRVKVELGKSDLKYFEVLSGLDENDEVLSLDTKNIEVDVKQEESEHDEHEKH